MKRGEAKALILSLLAEGKTGYAIHKLTKFAQSYVYRLKGECSPNNGIQPIASQSKMAQGSE
jgi:hypothetical protein